jgi:tetratricopeptide (TPR) repeat protein
MNALEIAEILCPDYFYIPYTRADILAYKGKKKEALAILEKLINRDPDINKQIPENHAFLRLAKNLYHDIKNGKG